MKEIKWFLGENDSGVFAVYKANFEGKTITDELQWYLASGDSWQPTERVSDWYWAGYENVWPCTQAEAERYLPLSALQLTNP